jgi:hypothetical protein
MMKNQDVSTYDGLDDKGKCSDIEIQLTKKFLITIPVRSKDPKDADETTKRIVKYIKDNLQYEVYRVGHVATGKWYINGRKEIDVTDIDKTQRACPSEEWKAKSQKIERIGDMCKGHKKRDLEVLDKKRQELAQRVEEIGQRDEDSNLELQEILLKENSQMWDRIEAYERYAEQEKALRTQAVSMLQRLEEKIFGTKEIMLTERKRPRVNMIIE